MTHEWRKASASDLGRGIEAGEIDPVELTDVFLTAMAKTPETSAIYARATERRAREEAAAASARAKSGMRKSRLDGVPISWKDLFDTAGDVTEAGSALLEGRVPTKDARVLSNATQAGLVCLGKTHMSELAFSGLGLNPVTATPPCKNFPGCVPGGSSSGAAASVAYDLAPAAIGSDTGGSVRIPAVWNDLVGLKTTHGDLSLEGVVPLCLSFDTVGPLTRTVEDASEIWSVLRGSAAPDLRGSSLSGRRFLVLENGLSEATDAPVAAFEDAIKRIERAGGAIKRTTSDVVSEALSLAAFLFPPEAYGQWQEEIEANPNKMYAPILERFRAGGQVSGAKFSDAWTRLYELRAIYQTQTAGFDAVLVPTSPTMPPNLERLMTDNEYYITQNLLALRNTRMGNMMGLPALTMPTGHPSCGISFMGAPASEAKLLRLGAAFEIAG